MKPATLKIACIALLGAAALAWGQDAVPPDEKVRTFGNGILSEHTSMYDLDNSGTLSAEEFQALQADRDRQGRRHQRFRERWDKNRDGRIDARERQEAMVRIRQLIEERRCRRFNEVDRNSDGFLTQEEFLAIAAVSVSDLRVELFKHLDHDGDNRISKAEFLRGLNIVRPTPIDPEVTPKPRESDALETETPNRPANP